MGIAVCKVVVVLLLKTLILPVLFGIQLDYCTMQVFGSSVAERVAYASAHPMLSLLMHWFLGITFMMISTVMLLQLRESLHPAILARFIKPPDMEQSVIEVS